MLEAEIAPDIDEVVQDAVQKAVQEELLSKEVEGSSDAFTTIRTSHQSLNLQYSEITGEIPTEIGQLTELKTLRLGGNEFAGSLPAEFGNLSQLSCVEAQSNELAGQIVTSIVPVVPSASEKTVNKEERKDHGNFNI